MGGIFHDPAKQKFYQSTAWKKVAKYVRIRDYYLCQVCGNKGTEVHHKIELDITKIGDEDYLMRYALNSDNLELRCVRCHNQERAKLCSDEVYIDACGMVRLKNNVAPPPD